MLRHVYRCTCWYDTMTIDNTFGVIQVRIKNVYGTDKVYPVCEKAMLFAGIAGTATLTDDTIRAIKTLGYIIQVTPVRSTL